MTGIFGKRLKQARTLAGLSQRALGIRASLDEFVASTRVNRYELGIHQPDYAIAQRLAAALSVPTAFLYADDDFSAEILLLLTQVPPDLRGEILQALRSSVLS